MELKRRLSLVVAILSVAFGSGHLVQNVLVKNVDLAVAEEQPVDITLVAAGPDLALPKPEFALQKLVLPSFAVTVQNDVPSIFTLPNDPIIAAEFSTKNPQDGLPANECAKAMTLSVEPSAMIGITVTAPCQPNQRVVLQHAGLTVTAKTSGTGALSVSLPALAADAVVSVRFPDGQDVTGNVVVPEAAGLRRYGVQWLGDDAFQLNAFENGADYGERGHVSDADTQRALAGQNQTGGYLLILGDDRVNAPMLAEIYTYPADVNTKVRIVVEAAITKRTCDREILGETLADFGGKLTITDLSLAMPDCSAVGDIVVLNNIDPEMQVASAN
jgi:hypothetical protein